MSSSPSERGRNLCPGDFALTQYSGRTQRVRITQRREGCRSQSGIMYRTEPLLRKARDASNPFDEFEAGRGAWFDADWFVPADVQGDLFGLPSDNPE